MRHNLFLVLILMLAAIPAVSAAVDEVTVTPEDPVQGDTLDIYIKADPNEELLVTITFERDLETTNGKYLLSVKDMQIPEPPNYFRVRASPVEDMTVTLIKAVRMSTTVTAVDGVATVSESDIEGGEYVTKVRGNAENGAYTVEVEIKARSTITTDENGECHFMFPTTDIPSGDYTAEIDSNVITITVSPQEPPLDTTPPLISSSSPTGEIASTSTTITAQYSDETSIDVSSIKLTVNGVDVTSQSTVTASKITYQTSALTNQTTYNAVLTVKDASGNQATESWSFTVKLPPPPDATPPQITSYQPQGTVETRTPRITVGYRDNKRVDASTVTLEFDGENVAPEVTENYLIYQSPELEDKTAHTVHVSLADKAGNTAELEWGFDVSLPGSGGATILPNMKPVAIADHPSDAVTGAQVRFDASSSYDPDGVITSYEWTIGSTTATGMKTIHTFTEAGLHTVTLRVTDNLGAHSTYTGHINVTEAEYYHPEADAGSNRRGFTNQTITFDASASSTLIGEITGFAWDYGDGTTGAGVRSTHVYSEPGVYTVTLTITTSDGATDSDAIKLHIEEHPRSSYSVERPITVATRNMLDFPEVGLAIRLNASNEVYMLVFQYEPGALSETSLPGNRVDKILDLSVSDPDAVLWPIRVELSFDLDQTTLAVDRLGLYYYLNGTWVPCSNTGVDLENNIVWAYMTRLEASGSPVLIAEIPTPASLIYVGTTIEPPRPKVGETVTITTTYRNDGDQQGEALVALVIDNETLKIDTLTVEPSDEASYIYTLVFDTSGEHTVNVQGESHVINVLPLLPDLTITGLSAPDKVEKGKEYTVSLSISNTGEDASPETTLSLWIEGEFFDTRSLPPIEPGSSMETSFSLTASNTGKQSLEVYVDPEGLVEETNEDNNSMEASVESISSTDYSIVFFAVAAILLVGYVFRERIKAAYEAR